MRSAIAFSLAAIAGSALAAPSLGYGYGDQPVKNVHVVVETVIHTVYQTEGGLPQPTPTPTPEQYYQAPPAPTPVYEAPTYNAPPPPPPAPKPVETPSYVAPAPAPEPSQPAASSVPDSGYMSVVEEYRAKLGLSSLTCSDELEKNAMKTVVESNGKMVHHLFDGSMAQVLAPGDADNFLHVFVGGWLCEIPTLPGLDGICSTQSDGWTYEGQTGHADILTSKAYSQIGCALHAGIWCCDLA